MKLYKINSEAIDFELDGGWTISEATPAEIMAAHPKCGECMYWLKNAFQELVCFNEESRLRYARTDVTDYCNKWEEK